jgi:glycosyltransferase involved in cell wall biosynthesis
MTKPLKIAHVTPYYLPAWRYGGPIRSVHGLCRALAAAGHDVHVFTTNVDGPGELDVPIGVPVDVDGVEVWYFPIGVLRRLYSSPQLTQAFSQRVTEFDIVHIHAVFLLPTLQAARAALKAGVPYVVSPRGVLVSELFRRKSFWIKTLWMKLFDNFTMEQAAAIHVTSRREGDEMAHFGLRLRKVCMIPNGVELPAAQEGELSSAVAAAIRHERMVLFIGRVSWEKGVDRLIRALPYVPDTFLAIAGNEDSAYGRRMRELATCLAVSDRLAFVGQVHGADKVALFSHAILLVLPSYSENFGNVVLEAMAAGCPVVVSEEVGAADAVREAKAGLVSRGDPEQLAGNIHAILENASLREKMSEAGMHAVREQYSWGIVASNMLVTYFEILAWGRLR